MATLSALRWNCGLLAMLEQLLVVTSIMDKVRESADGYTYIHCIHASYPVNMSARL